MPAQPNCNANTRDTSTTLLRNQIQNDHSEIVQASNHLRSNEASRPWKKCPPSEKKKFLQHLLDFLTSSFAGSDRTSLRFLLEGQNADLTLEEKVAKWQFIQMDRNKNNVRIKLF